MNQEARNKLIKAAQQLQEVQEATGTYLRARGLAYGGSRLYIVDESTGEEINYEEALLLQPVESEGEENV
ncbi:hypothetical protein ACF5W4_11325 [Bacillota bacterium Lsc_1132]